MVKMKKNILAVILSVAIFSICGISSAGTAIYKNNVLTASHVTPPGTHVSIVPPRDAVLSSTFAGFELQDNGRIQIAESVGASYKDTEGMLTPQGVESLNVSFKDKSPVSLNGSPATLVTGVSVSDPSTGVLLLVLGNDKMTVNIYGFYSADNKAAEAAVQSALLSCVFNPSSVRSASGDYTLSTSGTSFKFSDEVGAMRYFTVGGGAYDDASGALFTSTATDDFVPQEARNTYAAAAIDKYLSSYPQHAVVSNRAVNYGGLPGLETIAEFDGPVKRMRTASGANVTRPRKGKGYQVLLFDENEGKIYVFSGIATADPDSYVSQFVKITSTFALKR
jgi:hypothetical protein